MVDTDGIEESLEGMARVAVTAGARLGEMVDERVLDNYRCLACAYTFSPHPTVSDTP